jgi:hypothetical protein
VSFKKSAGERVLWEGKPAQGLRFAPQDMFAVPFAAIWLIAVVAIFGSILFGHATIVDPMAYIVMPLFVAVGLYMLVGRLWIDSLARKQTQYWLTSERAVIESGLLRSTIRSVSLAAVPEIQLRAGRMGRGTIRFGAPGPFAMMPSNWPGMAQFAAPAFEMVDDAQRVYDLALTTQRAAQAGRGGSEI